MKLVECTVIIIVTNWYNGASKQVTTKDLERRALSHTHGGWAELTFVHRLLRADTGVSCLDNNIRSLLISIEDLTDSYFYSIIPIYFKIV